jgi:hypothetical protein
MATNPNDWSTQKLKVELLIVEDTLAAEYLAVDKIQKSMKLVASNNFLLGVKLRQTNDRIFILENAQKLYKGILNSRKRKTKPAPQTIITNVDKNGNEKSPVPIQVAANNNINLTATSYGAGKEEITENGDTVIVYTDPNDGSILVTDTLGNPIAAIPTDPDPNPTSYGTGVHQGIIEGSIIAVTNKKRTHECDISLFVMKEKALAGIAMKIVKELRTAIAAIIAFFGINPGSSGIIETIKQIKAWVDDIREFLEDVVLKIAEYLAIVQKIGALIQYILGLPAEILAYFKSCLTQLYAELKRQFLDAVAAVSDEFSTGDNDTINEAKKLLASTKKLIQQTASTVQVVQSLPAATLSKITNPGTKPLTMEEAGNLAKDLLPTPLTTTKYEAA